MQPTANIADSSLEGKGDYLLKIHFENGKMLFENFKHIFVQIKKIQQKVIMDINCI